MGEISTFWQVFLHMATPVITGTLTIVGVLVAAKYADKRRRDDQALEDRRRAQERVLEAQLRKEEQQAADRRRKADQYAADRSRREDQRAADRRRQEDLEARTREQERELVDMSNERQRRAIGDFLVATGTTIIDTRSRVNETVVTQKSDPTIPAMMNQVQEYSHYRAVYERQYQELERAWQLLDLEVVHPELRKILLLIRQVLDDFTRSYSRYSKECIDHANAVAQYMNERVTDGQAPDRRKEFPGPTSSPQLDPQFESLLHQFRNAARQHLTLTVPPSS